MLAVIVLNYINYNDTIECVDSLLKQKYDDFVVVVVDNASGNESFEVLHQKYKDIKKVHIIKTDKNLGYAKGNNHGIIYARERFGADDAFILNSDTLLTTDRILSQLMEAREENVAVLSPCVKGTDGKRQYGQVIKECDLFPFTKRAYLSTYYDMLPDFLRNFLQRFKRSIKGKNVTKTEAAGDLNEGYYIVQGCAFLLTEEFFKFYKILFPKTFLYGEEINLCHYLHKAGLKTKRVMTDVIIHKEAQSTGQTVLRGNARRKKAKLSNKNMRISMPMYSATYEETAERYSENK
jgi:GT2 family glycosyltransferase